MNQLYQKQLFNSFQTIEAKYQYVWERNWEFKVTLILEFVESLKLVAQFHQNWVWDLKMGK
jgi:hypothetical protein